MIARRLTAFAAAGTIVLAACSGGGDSDAQADRETTVEDSSTEPADETSSEPADETADEPADDTSSEPADEPADDTSSEPADEPAGEPAPTPTEAPMVVPPILDVSATTIDGAEIELGEYAGRPVLLWFWAPW